MYQEVNTVMESRDIIRVRIRVYGIVQGVGFRYYTKMHADRLGVKGYVENKPDGSVEIVAEGPRDKVEKLLEIVRRGPPAAVVERVDVEYEEPRGEFDRFYIRWGGRFLW